MKKRTKNISIIAGMIAFCLLTIHVINKVIFFFSTLKELLYKENSNFYNWRFGKVFYTKKGTGSPVLLIHDLATTGSHYEWRQLSNQLAKKHTVYMIDLLGCGRSDKPKMTYTNYLYVQLVSDFITNVIKQKTTVITTRKSCAISVMACYINPTLFNKLIMINPTDLKVLNLSPKKKHKVLKWILDIPIIGTLLYNINNNQIRLSSKFRNEYLSNKKPVKKTIQAFSEAAHTSGSSSKYVYTSIKCHYTNTNMIHALKEINNSMYIIAGADMDRIDEITAEYEEYNPSIETVYIPNTKAFPHLERLKDCLNYIDLFINEV